MSDHEVNHIKCLLVLFLSLGTTLPAMGQVDNTYFRADQLLQQNQYQKAYPLFEELHSDNPTSYVFFDKATECLINLKRYDEAVELAERSIEQDIYPDQAGIRLGEVYHIKGNTTQAFQVWDEVLENNDGNLQIHLTLARTMSGRRAFNKAIEVYLLADEILKGRSASFSDSPVILSELADTYMQAGSYEKAIQKYLSLVKESPDRISYVQSTLLRFNDENLYDVAILEINDFLKDLPSEHPGQQGLHQLEVWLLLERELYERALAVAKEFEQNQSRVTYSLYSVGARLLSERQFELAEKAFSYYVDSNIQSARYQSMEELAGVYIEWADYLSNYNLAYSDKRDSLYQKAYHILARITREQPSYTNKNRVWGTLAELALDQLHNPGQARIYLNRLNDKTNGSYQAIRTYLQGRIHLYNGEYARARIAFTKSTKEERTGELAEKNRYYLALTDFYEGDYEFAKIQLNALERHNTSYFANDAVQLRVWIQEGLQADSTGKIISPFAKAVEQFSLGNKKQAVLKLVSMLQTEAYHPLADEALLELSSHVQPEHVQFTYTLLDKHLQTAGRFSPLRERLTWEKVRIADQVVTKNTDLAINFKPQVPDTDSLTVEERFFQKLNQDSVQIAIPTSKKQLITLYENLLMEFPQGFYANYARNRIQELQNTQT